ncbi:MAG: Holliday junction ATP-dependent DNA helicase RuvB [Candidatus Anoxychlamydiales bacterium]|nr:Holliday junction ATP-dependent DNA helicase RuvB [Candidatus Anoxychlamydiales bacterium]NGX36480.1 Holliday junction ATP-dependent DNA helicase RuvB [Candidatus Anoxychlamydiales bacterium]
MNENFIQSSLRKDDTTFEVPLRPISLDQFVGQENLKERLFIYIGAAKKRSDSLGHMLFSGPPGLGKTTLANIIAKTMNTNMVVTSGPVIEKAGDLAGVLTSLKDGDVLFIDEIHRLNKTIEEYLYPAMEDFTLDLLIDSGPNARGVSVKLNKFTLIGATTRSGLLSSPLRSRFSFNARLDYYNPNDLKQIILRSAKILKVELENDGAISIANRSRGTPRIANNLLKWVRDFAQMENKQSIDAKTVNAALKLLSIDELGLDEMDKKIINVIIDHYSGGPVGINTIGVAIGEEPNTLQEVYEPYLIMKGFLKRTSRGREVTKFAYEHMGKKFPIIQES